MRDSIRKRDVTLLERDYYFVFELLEKIKKETVLLLLFLYIDGEVIKSHLLIMFLVDERKCENYNYIIVSCSTLLFTRFMTPDPEHGNSRPQSLYMIMHCIIVCYA